MPDLRRSVGKAIEWPIESHNTYTDASAGVANDTYDAYVGTLPSVGHRFAAGLASPPSVPPRTRMQQVISEAMYIAAGTSNTVGNATNWADLRINAWRNGVLLGCLYYYTMGVNTTLGTVVQQQVSTTSSTAVTSGSTVITVPSAAGIAVDSYLFISGGTGTAEFVTVTAVSLTANTFTASFSNAHSGTYSITSVPVNTTAPTAVTSGSTVITPASMVGIYAKQCLYVYGATGTPEYVNVASVASTTFTATFQNAHSGTYNITSGAASVGGQNPANASSVVIDPLAFGAVLTAMTNVTANMALQIGSGATAETIYVQQTQNTTSIVANFTYSHADTDAVTSVLVPNQPILFTPANSTPSAGYTSNTQIAAGNNKVIPSSMYGIHVGDTLSIAGGEPFENNLTATTVASTALTATFGQLHAGTTHIGYYIATTCSNPGATPSTLTPASMAGLTVGQVLLLQGCGADSAVSDTVTVTVVGSSTITITGGNGTYSVTANLTSVAYLKATTTTQAARPGQVLAMASTTGIAAGDLVFVQGLAANGTTGAFSGTAGEVVSVQAVTTNTNITVSPLNVHTSTYAVVPFTKTTFATAVTQTTTGTTVTLTSGTGFNTGQTGIYVWLGTQAGITESVTVLTVGNYYFTAVFAQTHSGAYTIASTPTLQGPTSGQQLQTAGPNAPYYVIRPLDAITVCRVSNNATGLAAGIPTGVVQVEFVPAETLG